MRFNGPKEPSPKAAKAKVPDIEDEAMRAIEAIRASDNGNGKAIPMGDSADASMPIEAGPMVPPPQFRNEVINMPNATVMAPEYLRPIPKKTVSIDAGPLLPPGVNLNFADPKAAEWIRRAVPALGRIVEAMSIKPGGPGKPILLYGFVGFMMCLGIGIAYSMTVQKWQDTNNDFQLNWLKLQVQAHNGTRGAIIPSSAAPQAPTPTGGGTLCIINPFNGPTNHC